MRAQGDTQRMLTIRSEGVKCDFKCEVSRGPDLSLANFAQDLFCRYRGVSSSGDRHSDNNVIGTCSYCLRRSGDSRLVIAASTGSIMLCSPPAVMLVAWFRARPDTRRYDQEIFAASLADVAGFLHRGDYTI